MTDKKLLFYTKVKLVQETYLKHKVHDGISDGWIYREYIRPVHCIAYTTFRSYLNMNVKQKLNAATKDKDSSGGNQ